MKAINEMVGNKESRETVMERILSGKDLKSKIEKFVIVNSADLGFSHFENKGSYARWNFHRTISTLKFGHIKNVYVNPDLGKEGIHSNKDHFELYYTAS